MTRSRSALGSAQALVVSVLVGIVALTALNWIVYDRMSVASAGVIAIATTILCSPPAVIAAVLDQFLQRRHRLVAGTLLSIGWIGLVYLVLSRFMRPAGVSSQGSSTIIRHTGQSTDQLLQTVGTLGAVIVLLVAAYYFAERIITADKGAMRKAPTNK